MSKLISKLELVDSRKLLLTLVIVGFILRVLFAIFRWFEQDGASSFVDAWDYIGYAKVILEEGPFPTDVSKIRAFSPPGYPWLLSVIFFFFGENYYIPIALNLLLSTLMIVLIYKVAERYFNKSVAVLSAVWCTVYVKFFEHLADVGKENLHYVFVLISLLLFHKLMQTKTNKYIIIFAIFFAVWVHFDERFIGFIPWFIISYWVFGKLKPEYFKQVLLFSLIFFLLQVPWTIRNYYAYDRVVLLTERVGVFTDKFQGKIDENRYYKRSKRFENRFQSFRDSINSGYEPTVNSSRKARIKDGMQMGFQPYSYPFWRVKWESLKYLWQPVKLDYGFIANGWKFKGPWSLRNNVLTVIVYGTMLPFLLMSLVISVKRRNRSGLILWGIIISHTLIHVFVAHGNPRYRIPIDSLIIVLSMYALMETFLRSKLNTSQRD